jgi:hypothetical protein
MAKKYVVYNGDGVFATPEEFAASPWFIKFSSVVLAEDHSDLGFTTSVEKINNRWVAIVNAASDEDIAYFNEHTLVSHASVIAELLSEALVPDQAHRNNVQKVDWINAL